MTLEDEYEGSFVLELESAAALFDTCCAETEASNALTHTTSRANEIVFDIGDQELCHARGPRATLSDVLISPATAPGQWRCPPRKQ